MRKLLISIGIALASMAAFGQGGANAAEMTKGKAELARCEKAYTVAKAAFAKKPSSGPAKRAYIDSTVKFGTAAMTLPVLDRKIKYKKALHLYREALKLEPTNKEALSNSQMIISIYHSMGRPVPN
jgi:tetratricopeptide (TPR) repeat protein